MEYDPMRFVSFSLSASLFSLCGPLLVAAGTRCAMHDTCLAVPAWDHRLGREPHRYQSQLW